MSKKGYCLTMYKGEETVCEFKQFETAEEARSAAAVAKYFLGDETDGYIIYATTFDEDDIYLHEL